MRTLHKNLSGEDVLKFQHFLLGFGYVLEATGTFDDRTEFVAKKWQKSNSLASDGWIGRDSWRIAISEGFPVVEDLSDNPIPTAPSPAGAYPWKPSNLLPYTSNEERMNVFGRFTYVSAPEKGNKEAIKITNNWEEKYIVQASVPALYSLGLIRRARVSCHAKMQGPLESFISEAHKQKLLTRLVRSWDGLWVPRFIRGSRSTLSNHAWGSAFDINADWNPLGREPASYGKEGCVYDLVPLAASFGLYWGGHFSRRDGMHFELGREK